MIRHVFFDFFGTLVNYDPDIHPAARNAPYEFATAAGVTISAEACAERWQQAWNELDARAHETGVECSMREIANRFWELLGRPTVDDRAFEQLIADYLDAWCRNIRIADGAAEAVATIADEFGLGVSVVSNTHHSALVPSLVREFGLDTHLSTVVTSVDVGWRKPHPQIFEHALAQQGVTAAEAIYVGDNWIADVEGPTAIGMPAIYVGAAAPGRDPVRITDLPEVIRDRHLWHSER